MSKEPLWSSGFNDLQSAAKKAGAAASTLTLTNHRIAGRQFETRFAFRNSAGQILAVARIKRNTRYMNQDYEDQVVCVAQKIANDLPDSSVRISGEPYSGGGYPLFDGDPINWETEFTESTN